MEHMYLYNNEEESSIGEWRQQIGNWLIHEHDLTNVN